MIMTTQTIIGTLSMLRQRIPDADGALDEAIAHIANGEHLGAIGCLDSLISHNMASTTSECVALMRVAVAQAWGES